MRNINEKSKVERLAEAYASKISGERVKENGIKEKYAAMEKAKKLTLEQRIARVEELLKLNGE